MSRFRRLSISWIGLDQFAIQFGTRRQNDTAVVAPPSRPDAFLFCPLAPFRRSDRTVGRTAFLAGMPDDSCQRPRPARQWSQFLGAFEQVNYVPPTRISAKGDSIHGCDHLTLSPDRPWASSTRLAHLHTTLVTQRISVAMSPARIYFQTI